VLWCVVPVLFALSCAYGIIWLLSRQRLTAAEKTVKVPAVIQHTFNRPHTIKGLVILLIVIGLFFSPLPKELIALTAAAIHLASPKFRTEDLLKLVDWPILVLFMGLFVVTGAFQTTGYGEQATQWLARGGLHLQSPATLALVTATLSNLINNSAAVMLLLKVADVAQPPAAYVLALANSFGGSLLIVGSVSNIIVVQQARELGIHISFRDFARLGIPVTLAALAGLIGWVLLVT
jgi:Na+/H+ antiporter NhaD/arsenite permease-like protein